MPKANRKGKTKEINVPKLSKKKMDEMESDIKTLTISYTFLLSSLIIFLLSLESFKLNLFNNSVSIAIFIMPLAYFLVDMILKEIGLKPAKIAIVVSTIILFIAILVTDNVFNIEFNILKYIGTILAYSISQFLNISIYYYMLGNYKTPLFFVFLNLVFALLVNNMFYMFFNSNMIFNNTFWAGYIVVICIQTLICMILAIILNLIEQGIEV